MNTLLLSKSDVKKLLSMELAIESVKEAYTMFHQKSIQQPPIMSIDIKGHNGEMDVKSCYALGNNAISIKIASGYWDNPKNYMLPTMIANITILDGKTGYPLCIMDGSLITGYRTGAAGGLSAALLARKDTKSVAVIGAGNQARMQTMAVKEVLNINEVRVYAPVFNQMDNYKQDIESSLNIKVNLCDSPEEAVRGADLVITATPASEAIVKSEWINDGTHIIAVGADMAGKQELETAILRRARIYVDSKAQCLERGETRNAIMEHVISESDIQGELADVLVGKLNGRIADTDITLFDTTGMGVQDNTLAYMIYRKALECGMGQTFDFFCEESNQEEVK